MSLVRPIDQLTLVDLHSLVTEAVREGRSIEYKQSLPSGTDEDKKELLADLTSFANASGGHLVYGVVEQRDAQGKATGVPDRVEGLAGVNADAEVRRLEDVLRSCVAPRIAGVRFRVVDGGSSGPCVVVHVPRSWAGPHMVTFKGSSRFYARNSAGKYQLDVGELRTAFLLSESLGEKLRSFRRERLALIQADETPMPLAPYPRVVLHLVPVGALDHGNALDLPSIKDDVNRMLKPLYTTQWGNRFNIDGFVSFTQFREDAPATSYTQLFRSASIEAVDAQMIQDGGTDKVVMAAGIEKELIDATQQYLALLEHLSIPTPVSLFVSLLGVRGYQLGVGPRYAPLYRRHTIDRDVLLLPDVVVDEYVELRRPDVILRPVFDALWQSAGWSRCFHYDDAGRWAPRE